MKTLLIATLLLAASAQAQTPEACVTYRCHIRAAQTGLLPDLSASPSGWVVIDEAQDTQDFMQKVLMVNKLNELSLASPDDLAQCAVLDQKFTALHLPTAKPGPTRMETSEKVMDELRKAVGHE